MRPHSEATIRIFPISRRADLVRHVATVGLGLPTQERKDAYWRRRISYFRRQMLEAGMRPLHAERELLEFRTAVAKEVERLRRQAKRPVLAPIKATAEAPAMARVS